MAEERLHTTKEQQQDEDDQAEQERIEPNEDDAANDQSLEGYVPNRAVMPHPLNLRHAFSGAPEYPDRGQAGVGGPRLSCGEGGSMARHYSSSTRQKHAQVGAHSLSQKASSTQCIASKLVRQSNPTTSAEELVVTRGLAYPDCTMTMMSGLP